VELCQTLILEKWYSLKQQLASLPPIAVKGDTLWWVDQPEHAWPMGIGQELLQFAEWLQLIVG